MNTLMMQMRHTAHELRVTLDHVLQGGEASLVPQNNENKPVSFLSEPEAEMSAIHDIPEVRATAHSKQLGQLLSIWEEKETGVPLWRSWLLFCLFQDDHNFLYLSEHLRVPKNLYERMAEVTDYKKYTSALLMIIFDRETLATHSVQGRRNTINGEDSQKPQLPPEILRSIIGKKASQWASSVHVLLFLNTRSSSRSRVGQVRRWPQPNKDGHPH